MNQISVVVRTITRRNRTSVTGGGSGYSRAVAPVAEGPPGVLVLSPEAEDVPLGSDADHHLCLVSGVVL